VSDRAAMKKRDSCYDVVIVGGGIMGCCTAYYLMREESDLKLAVVERDPTYSQASTTLSMANVRTQFSLRENILISKYTLEVLQRFDEEMAVDGEAPDIAFHREGNLFLYDEQGLKTARRAIALQRSLGCRVELLSPDEIASRYPLYNTEGIAGGTFGPDDGYLDAFAMLTGFKTKAAMLGAELITGDVSAILADDGRASGVELASGRRLTAGYVINCAGAWAAEVAATAGIELPIHPVKRQVFALDTEVKPGGPLPLTNLPSGLYLRSEVGDIILCGKSMDDDPVGIDFSCDSSRFTEILWPELVKFIPTFDRLRLIRGWAGLYAVNTFDYNALLGEWPELQGFYLANGFSGHGLQQGPAVGRYLAETILGREPSLDLAVFLREQTSA